MHRRRLARLGEQIAARFLEARGASVLERNLMVGRGELDLLVRLDDRHVAVEVKTVGPTATTDQPIDRISDDKLLQVRRLATSLPRAFGVVRVDFVGVALNADGVQVNWRTNVA